MGWVYLHAGGSSISGYKLSIYFHRYAKGISVRWISIQSSWHWRLIVADSTSTLGDFHKSQRVRHQHIFLALSPAPALSLKTQFNFYSFMPCLPEELLNKTNAHGNWHHVQKLSLTCLRKLTAAGIVDYYHFLTQERRECHETFTWVSNYSSQPTACNSTPIAYGHRSGLEEELEWIN